MTTKWALIGFQNGGVTWSIDKFNALRQIGIALQNANFAPLNSKFNTWPV